MTNNRDWGMYAEEPTVDGPEDELIVAEELLGLQDAVDNLPLELRNIYELWHTGDYSIQELADEFQISRGEVKGSIRRLKKYLRDNVDVETAMAIGLLHPTAGDGEAE